jgi:hypothetical protein
LRQFGRYFNSWTLSKRCRNVCAQRSAANVILMFPKRFATISIYFQERKILSANISRVLYQLNPKLLVYGISVNIKAIFNIIKPSDFSKRVGNVSIKRSAVNVILMFQKRLATILVYFPKRWIVSNNINCIFYQLNPK